MFALAITVSCVLIFGVPSSDEGRVGSFRAFDICILDCAVPGFDAVCSSSSCGARADAVVNLSATMVLSASADVARGALAAGATACSVAAASSMDASAAACDGAAW